VQRVLTGWPASGPPLAPFGASTRDAVRVVEAAEFKGLEAAAVAVVGVRELHELETLRRMYVACSRARVLLAVVIDESARDDFNVRAAEYARRNIEAK
jgi:hypothetical protein